MRYCGCFSSFAGWRVPILLQLCAALMVAAFAFVIFGRHGGPFCSSCVELFQALRWSSASRDSQVVRPRQSGVGQHQRFIDGEEFPSISALPAL